METLKPSERKELLNRIEKVMIAFKDRPVLQAISALNIVELFLAEKGYCIAA